MEVGRSNRCPTCRNTSNPSDQKRSTTYYATKADAEVALGVYEVVAGVVEKRASAGAKNNGTVACDVTWPP